MITPDTALSPELELDAGFRAAKDWFFANEVEREETSWRSRGRWPDFSAFGGTVLYGKDLLRPGEAADRRKAGRRGRLE